MTDQGKAKGKGAKQAGASPHRMLIGANVIVATLLVAALVIAANFVGWWTTKRYSLTADLTATRQFSFSGRTKQLLGRIDEPVRLVSLYGATADDHASGVRLQRVDDVLRQYERNGRQVQVETVDPKTNPARLRALGERIAKAYVVECQPYVKTIQDFLEFKAEVAKTLLAEKQRYAAFSERPDLTPEMKSLMQRIVAVLDDAGAQIQNLEVDINALTLGELGEGTDESRRAIENQQRTIGIPDYSRAAHEIASMLTGVSQLFGGIPQVLAAQLTNEGMKAPAELRKDASESEERFKDIRQKLADFAGRIDALKPLELDEVRNSLAPDSVVVEASGKVRVVSFDEMWPTADGSSRMSPTAERRDRCEEAITATLLRMTSKEQAAVVFVQWGGMPINDQYGDFRELASRLKHANFLIGNWSVMNQEAPPKVSGASKTVYVLMMPAPPNPQMPTPPPTVAAYEPVRTVLSQGASAMVFVRADVSPMMPKAPYLDVLKQWGITAKVDHMLIWSRPTEAEPDFMWPALVTVDYPSKTNQAHPMRIVEPLEGMSALLPAACPLELASPLPAGVTAWSLVEAPERKDHWAESDIMTALASQKATFDLKTDIAAPFPIAVAAERSAGGDGQGADVGEKSRLVVFGTDSVAEDRFAGPSLRMTEEGQIGVDYPYPANGEILVNSLLWLSGQDDMISVSPRAQQARRIGAMGMVSGAIIRWGLPIGLPVLILVFGLIVYSFRNRKR